MPSILKSSKHLPKKSDLPIGSLERNLATDKKIAIVSDKDPDELLYYGDGPSAQQKAAFCQYKQNERAQSRKSNNVTTYSVSNVTAGLVCNLL